MIALLDADLIAYRCSASSENDPVEIAHLRCYKLFNDLLEQTKADSFRGFLSGGENFRKLIDPLYKANRKDQPSPKHLESCREYLITQLKCEITDGIEADDAMGISQCAAQENTTVIVSLDKDMLQVPGNHYRWQIQGTSVHGKQWVKEAEWLNVSFFDGLVSFYVSSLVGDVADNIFGVKGLGKAKAPRVLEGCTTEQELFNTCRELYSDDERYFRNLKLLWIYRTENDTFCPAKRGLINE